MAPETIINGVINEKTDIWNLGVILYTLFLRRLPFDNSSVSIMKNEILNCDPLFNVEIHHEFEDLLKSLLLKDPVKRFSAKQMSEHHFLRNFDFIKYEKSYQNKVKEEDLDSFITSLGHDPEEVKSEKDEGVSINILKQEYFLNIDSKQVEHRVPHPASANKPIFSFNPKNSLDPMKILAQKLISRRSSS